MTSFRASLNAGLRQNIGIWASAYTFWHMFEACRGNTLGAYTCRGIVSDAALARMTLVAWTSISHRKKRVGNTFLPESKTPKIIDACHSRTNINRPRVPLRVQYPTFSLCEASVRYYRSFIAEKESRAAAEHHCPSRPYLSLCRLSEHIE